MYGTVTHMKVKEGQQDAVAALLTQWVEERKPKVDGAVATYCYKLDNNPNVLVIATVFRDKDSYFRNADDPAQDAWYQKLRALLDDDPTWEDGEVIFSD